jgi:hypothetical protein
MRAALDGEEDTQWCACVRMCSRWGQTDGGGDQNRKNRPPKSEGRAATCHRQTLRAKRRSQTPSTVLGRMWPR